MGTIGMLSDRLHPTYEESLSVPLSGNPSAIRLLLQYA
jgi:hypothetical protein